MRYVQNLSLSITKRIVGNKNGFILVISLVLLATLTLVGGTALIITSSESKVVANFKTGEKSLYLAMAGTEYAKQYLRANLDLDTNLVNDQTQVFVNNQPVNWNSSGILSALHVGASGSLSIVRDTTDPSLATISSTASFGSGNETVEIVVKRTSPTPSVPGAINQISNGDNEFRIEDNAVADGNEESGNCPDVAGLVWEGSSLDLDLHDPSAALLGSPPDRQYDSATDDAIFGDPTLLLNLVSQWSSLPGVVTISGQPPATLGTAASPQITILEGSGDVKDSPFTGYGILIVTGELEIRNNFEFHGLIIVNSSDRVRIRDGTSQGIHGALIVVSNSDTDVRLEDQTGVVYNCDDINNYAGSLLPGAGPLSVVSWRQQF